MNLFGDRRDRADEVYGDAGGRLGRLLAPARTETEPEPVYPPARESLFKLRALVDKMRGTMKISRVLEASLLGNTQASWLIEAKFSSAIDYELEIRGSSFDEVTHAALETLEQMVP